MRQILFEIGPFKLYSYGLMLAIGVIAAFMVAEKRSPKKGLDPEQIFSLGIWCAVGGFLGAKVLYLITEYEKLFAGRMTFRDVMYGFVVYGGIIGGILAGYLYCKVKKLNFLKYFDLVMPEIALAQGFGRIGCFLAGCCYGRQTDSCLGVMFPEGSMAPSGVKLLPTQLFMSAGDFLIALALILYARKNKVDGNVGAGYLVLYGVGRFAIEFLRNDVRGSVGALSTSQFISIFIVAAGVALMVWNTLRFRKGLQKAEE